MLGKIGSISILLLACFSLAGCSNSNSPNTIKDGIEKLSPTQTALEQYLKRNHRDISNLVVNATRVLESSRFVEFTFSTSDGDYMGLAYLESLNSKLSVVDESDLPMSPEAKRIPIYVMELSGTTRSRDKQEYDIVSGHVNDTNIKKVLISYKGGSQTLHTLDNDQADFIDVRIGKFEQTTIQGLSADDNVIYQER